MKKILNLLAGVTLVASSVAPVIACGSKGDNPDQDKVNSIVKDITTKNLTLPYGQGDYSFAKDKTKLVNDLIKANPKLTADDAKYITIVPTSGDTIGMESATATNANVNVHVGKAVSNPIPFTYQVNNTWTKEASGSGIPPAAKFHVSPVNLGTPTKPVYYLGSAANGLWRKDGTDAKAQWTQANGVTGLLNLHHAIIDSPPVNLGTEQNPQYYQATQNEGLWMSTNGIRWTHVSSIIYNENKLVTAPVKIGDSYYQSTDGNNLWTSTDGTNWQTVAPGTNNGIPNTAKLLSPVTRLQTGGTKAAPTYSYYQATDGDGLYKYTASGPFSAANALAANAWTKVSGITANGMVTAPVRIGNYLFQATTDNGLWRSEDNGNSWQKVPNIPATANLSSPPVNLGTTTSPVLYQATVNNGLWRSTNKGDSWAPVNGIPQSHTANLVSAPKNLGTPAKPLYFQGSDGAGVWTSTDGLHWTQNPTEGLKSADIESTPVKMDGVYVATSDSATTTNNNGLWRIKPPTT